MKRMGLDARLIVQTGVGTYIQNLLRNFNPSGYELYIFCLKEDVKHVRMIQPNATIVETRARWHSVAEQTIFLKQLLACNLDLMHFTYFSFPILYPRPFIITMHDLTPLTHKTGTASTKSPLLYRVKHEAYKQVLSAGIHNSKAIITPTKQIKEEILKYFKIPENKIHAIYEGINDSLLSLTSLKTPGFKLPPKFILRVGNYYPHKNVERLLKVFESAKTDLHLVSVGPDDHFAKQIQKDYKDCHPALDLPAGRQGAGSKPRIHFLNQVSNNDLAYLYQHATALIQPSLTEGFGLPLLEAAHFGIPILASDIPVFRELIGDYATYFNPKSEKEMKKAIESVSKSNIPNLPKVPKEILKRFSFKNMAEETERVYESVILA